MQDYTDALIAQLRARPGLAGVIITDGVPPANVLGNMPEWIMIGDVHGSEDWVAVAQPRRPKDEEFTIDILVDVLMPTTPGSDVQPTCNRRAMELLAEVEDTVRIDPQQGLGDANINPGYVIVSGLTSKNLLKRGDDQVREAAIEAGLAVKVRL